MLSQLWCHCAAPVFGLPTGWINFVCDGLGAFCLGEVIQMATNRWRKIDQGFNMVEHYSHTRDLMPVTWRYLYVQQDGETSLASWVGDGKAQSLIRILDGCVSFMLNKYVGIIYFGVFIGMEDYSKMTRLWVDRAIYDTPVLDDGFTNCG